MKFLQAAVLAAIYMGYVTASDPGYTGHLGLHRAIDEGRLDIAVDLGKQDKARGETGVEYVIEKDDPAFIASFVSQTNQANARTLEELWRKSSIKTIEKVLDKVDFSQQALVDLASSYGVASKPEKFLVLLNKIVKPEDQEKVVKNAIEQVVYRPTETSRLLKTLKGKTFRNERLEYIAIQKAFMEGVKHDRVDRLPEDICEHGAITPELYADALIVSDKWGHNYSRRFLLENADRYDLETLKEKVGYADLESEFRDVIEEALKIAAPGGTRQHKSLVQSAEKAEETFEGLGYFRESEEPVDLISAYLGVDKPTPRRKAKKTVNWIRLRGVIDRRELETAVVMYKRDKLLHHKGIEYVIGQQFPEFIVSFIRNAYETNGYILNALCKKCSKETVENVLEKVNFSQKDLIGVASEGNVVCHLPKFLMLLNKITTPEGQESVITIGMNALIREKSAEFINPMLDALKDKTFRSEHLEAIAIQMTFKEGVKHNREDLLKRTFEHPAITPRLYADALIESEKSWESSKLTREWLLKKADRDDLQAVNDNDGYADLIPPFRNAIENAWEIAPPGGTRTRAYDIQSAEKTKKEFMDIEHAVAIPGIANIIGEYLAGVEDDEMEVEGVLQEQEEEEDVEMGAVDEEEWGEGEEAELGGGEDEEEEEWGDI